MELHKSGMPPQETTGAARARRPDSRAGVTGFSVNPAWDAASSLHAAALAATVAHIQGGVFVLARGGGLIHANSSGLSLLAEDGPL